MQNVILKFNSEAGARAFDRIGRHQPNILKDLVKVLVDERALVNRHPIMVQSGDDPIGFSSRYWGVMCSSLIRSTKRFSQESPFSARQSRTFIEQKDRQS
jgi:hypothetical protein